MGYAVVLGEALVDLLEAECGGERVYREAVGGGPLNVAVGVARLGGAVEFAGSLGGDTLGDRIARFLTDAGVGTRAVARVAAPTALALATFTGAEPDFRFYGEPPSYGLYDPSDLDASVVGNAKALYCGSIALLRRPVREAAREAWTTPGPLRAFDPNVRTRLLPDAAALGELRSLVNEFAATAHLVKLSAADAAVLFPGSSLQEAAERLQGRGAGTVVITRGPAGALVATAGGIDRVPAPQVHAVDATGAGDAVMAALLAQLLAGGAPADAAGWREYVRFSLQVAGLVCESPGAAVAMPTMEQVRARFGAEAEEEQPVSD